MIDNQKTNKLIQIIDEKHLLDTSSITKNSNLVLNYLMKKRPIMRYNKETKTDEPIVRLNNSTHSFLLTINPEWELNEYQIKDLFNYLKNRYAQFVYGRKWTELFNFKYDGVVEIQQDKSRHLHTIFYDIPLNEMAIMFNYVAELTDHIYPRHLANDNRFHCKIIDETANLINTKRLKANPLYKKLSDQQKQQVIKDLTTEQIGQLNTFNYMTKSDYLYFSNTDFIRN